MEARNINNVVGFNKLICVQEYKLVEGIQIRITQAHAKLNSFVYLICIRDWISYSAASSTSL